MPTPTAQLTTIRDQTLQRIVDITAQPKPSYSVDGQSFSHAEYLAQLRQTLTWCNEQLAANEVVEVEEYGY